MAYSILDYNNYRTQANSGAAPIGPSSPGYVQGTANMVKLPVTGGQVLGASTSATGGSSTKAASTQPAAQAPANNTPTAPNYNDVNELYAPQMSYLDSLMGQIGDTKNQQLGDVQSRYAAESAKLQPEQQQLEGDLGIQENQFNNSITSAYDAAIRARNALGQQAQSRFGRGSSAYGATTDLADQEFYRQQGNVNQQKTQGDLQFGQEHTKIKSYISNKLSDLDQWKNDTISKVNDNFTQMMASINANKIATEQQKTRDKMGLLQQTIAQSQAIAQADQQYKQQLATFAVQQLQGVSGKTMTIGEIKAQIQDIMSGLNIGGSTPQGTTNLAGVGGSNIFGNNSEDQQGLTG